MEITIEQLAGIVDGLTCDGIEPPVGVAQAMIAMVGERVDCLLGGVQFGEEQTTWRAAAVAGNWLAFVEATRPTARWDRDSGIPDALPLTAWARPISQVRAIEVTQINTPGPRGTGRALAYTVDAAVVLDDELRMSVPLFSGAPRRRNVPRERIFLMALRDRLRR